jgi:hypothetical protein
MGAWISAAHRQLVQRVFHQAGLRTGIDEIVQVSRAFGLGSLRASAGDGPGRSTQPEFEAAMDAEYKSPASARFGGHLARQLLAMVSAMPMAARSPWVVKIVAIGRSAGRVRTGAIRQWT